MTTPKAAGNHRLKAPPPGLYPEFEFMDEWLIPLPGSALDDLAKYIKTEVEWFENRERKRKPVDAQRFDHLVRAVVANLAREHVAPSKGEGWLGTKRWSGRTKAFTYYDCPAFGLQWNNLADHLEAMGLILQREGEIQTNGIRGNARSLKATTLLAERIEAIRHGLRFARAENEPVIVLASSRWIENEETFKYDKEKDRHDVPATAQSLSISKRVSRINNMLAAADIAVVGADGHLSRSFSGKRPLAVRRHFTITHAQIEVDGLRGYRFDRGGRLYGGFWQYMPKTERHRIRINGDPVSIVDYRSMNAHIAYSLAGTTPPDGDLYAVPGLEQYRPEVKRLFNAMLSWPEGRPFKRWPKSIREGNGPLYQSRIGPEKASGLIASFHKDLAGLFSAGRIGEIQYIESETILRVLDLIIDQGIVGLPVHDAMIVPVKDAEKVAGIMRDAALSVVGLPIDVSL
ncbi:hypothetical protein NFO65_13485 [Neorhizobium galegae]|uniref:hypothetical protein n=1 Tax=Neorhizobium galegae TaxID=399 RepID=UPI002101CB97|nr:hypothetical protein [Neorhizobium galegae]MCQ1571739.1 hypothetical protein [Neorhizobium galegae]